MVKAQRVMWVAAFLTVAALLLLAGAARGEDRQRKAKVALALAAPAAVSRSVAPAGPAKLPCVCGDNCKCKETGKACPGGCPVAWRTDYDAARKESAEKKLPMFVVVGTTDCVYCRKLEGGPLKDAAVAEMLHQFVCLKLDAEKEPAVAKALKVRAYPTVVAATADGTVRSFVEGYADAETLTAELKKTLAAGKKRD
jgi:thiol:disulfide interchange protein